MLEALTKFRDNNGVESTGINSEPEEDISPEVYVRQNKEKELDVLWKDFRLPKGERSPIVYLGIGFISGIITTLIISAFIGMSSGNFHLNLKKPEMSTSAEKNQPSKSGKLNFLPSSSKTDISASDSAGEEYSVEEGDTLESISRRFYGSYSPDKIDAIMRANNMADANKLSIGQKLIIPMGATYTAEEEADTAEE